MITDRYIQFLDKLKESISEMILERSRISTANCTERPSPIWSEVVSVYKYLLNLSPEDFQNIRFHTELINGISLLRYWHPYPQLDPEAEAKELGYVRATAGIPKGYWLTEPPTPSLPRPLGVSYQGYVVNSNIVRYQTCVSNLYLMGALQFVGRSNDKQIVVEVGGGYGGLAHGLVNIFGDKATYVLIDLPEMLLLQGAFLALHNPTKDIYVYDEATFTRDFAVEGILDYDVVLIPNYVLDRLETLKDIAIFINMQSFQEMSEQQIRSYLNLAKGKVSYCIYSDNMDRHPHNTSEFSLSHLLGEYFELMPAPEFYEKLYRGVDPLSYVCYKRHFGFADACKEPINNMIDKIFVEGTRQSSEALVRWRVKRLVSMIPGLKRGFRVARTAIGS